MPEIPVVPDIDLTTTPGHTKTAVETILQGRYNAAIDWAQWAATMLNKNIVDINNLLGEDIAGSNLTTVQAAIDTITAYIPPVGLTYNGPAAPAYTAIPAYASPTLGALSAVPTITATMGPLVAVPTITATMGALEAIPAITDLSVGAAPATVVSFDNSDFTSTLGDSLTAKLAGDLANGSTGLGNAEDALFARETARQNAARVLAYNEVTNQFAARGFDMPPGALLAKQTEINNESNTRLADSSAQIMAESARLAVDYNKAAISGSVQMVELMSRIFDSKIMRSFEASKNTVMMAIEVFKQTIAVAIANADVQKKRVDAVVSANEGIVRAYIGAIDGQKAAIQGATESNTGTVEVFKAEVEGQRAAIQGVVTGNAGVIEVFKTEVEGQTAPMKAIADSNQATASSYRAAVEGAKAALEAQVIPEELEIKGLELNARIAEVKGRLAESQARLTIDNAMRQLQLEVTTLSGLANGATQLIAGALNGVSASVSEGWSGRPQDPLPTEGTTDMVYDADGNMTQRKHNPNLF